MTRKNTPRARKHHLGSPSGAAMTLRPPYPRRPLTRPVADADHRHKKHMKQRMILQACGGKGTGPYEVEFYPDCPNSASNSRAHNVIDGCILTLCSADILVLVWGFRYFDLPILRWQLSDVFFVTGPEYNGLNVAQ